MFRVQDAAHALRGRAPRPRAARALFPLALVSTALALPEVSSLTVSPTDLPNGGSAGGTVRVVGLSSSTLASRATVVLSSSNPSVVTVPASIDLSCLGERCPDDAVKTFSVAAVAGAVGCATISARVGATPAKSTVVYVRPPPSPGGVPALSLQLPANEILGAPRTTSTGTVGFLQIAAGTAVVVQLSSNDWGVTVPATVTVPLEFREPGVFAGNVSFPIRLNRSFATPSCAVITAKTGTLERRALLKIRPLEVIGS